MLSDQDIKSALYTNVISVLPAPDLDKQLGSCSLDLRLGDNVAIMKTYKRGVIDTRDVQEDLFSVVDISKSWLDIKPGEFILAETLESISLPSWIAGRLEGRSSLGRVGLIVHATANIIDAGWSGKIVLELQNTGPLTIRLYTGMRVCSVTFENLDTPSSRPYRAKPNASFTNQTGVTGWGIKKDLT